MSRTFFGAYCIHRRAYSTGSHARRVLVILVVCVVIFLQTGMSDASKWPMIAKASKLFPQVSRERRSFRRSIPVQCDAAEQEVVPETDIGNAKTRVWVVTTASLPWMTGTSINPLLRAAFLTRGRDSGMVTLMVPFLSPEEQPKLFPPGVVFETPEEQEASVREWLKDAGLERESDRLRLLFYPGKYHKDYGSIFPMGDLTQLVPPEEADLCILEEPEHLNWYRAPGRPWRRHFKHVVGVVHTNYLAYSSGYSVFAPLLTFLLRYMNIVMARAYCHKIIKLSPVIQNLAPEKEMVCNVHGVREVFFDVADEYTHKERAKEAYFVGKSLWAKGYDRLIDLLAYDKKRLGRSFKMDIYGSGPDKEAIMEKAKQKEVDCSFFPATDHAKLGKYRVFINPSVSEVLCTTVAEALAMGKWVVCARHPSNEFFYKFPNCLPFSTEEEFASCVSWAIRHEPEELSVTLRYHLTWAAATERLASAAAVTVGEQKRRRPVADTLLTVVHQAIGAGPSGDVIRLLAGGNEAAWQNKYMREEKRERVQQEKELADQELVSSSSSGAISSQFEDAGNTHNSFDDEVGAVSTVVTSA